MQGVYLLSGTAIFPADPRLNENSVIRLVLEDITTEKLGVIRVAEKQVEFDADDLNTFKYLNFDFRDFDIDEGRKYALTMHVDKNGSGKVEEGDFVSKDTYHVVSGLEQFQIQLMEI